MCDEWVEFTRLTLERYEYVQHCQCSARLRRTAFRPPSLCCSTLSVPHQPRHLTFRFRPAADHLL